MSAALQAHTAPLPEGLGFRHDARFEPDPAAPARVSLIGHSGWRTSLRGIQDVSMGGLSVILSAAEARQAVVPERVTVELELFGTSVIVRARTVHRTKSGRRFFLKDREVGVRFEAGPEYDTIAPFLERYLKELNSQGRRIGP